MRISVVSVGCGKRLSADESADTEATMWKAHETFMSMPTHDKHHQSAQRHAAIHGAKNPSVRLFLAKQVECSGGIKCADACSEVVEVVEAAIV